MEPIKSKRPVYRLLQLSSRLPRLLLSDPIPVGALLLTAVLWSGIGDAAEERTYDAFALLSQLLPQLFEPKAAVPPRSIVLVPLLGIAALVLITLTGAVVQFAVTRWDAQTERTRSNGDAGTTLVVLTGYGLACAVAVLVGAVLWDPLGVFVFLFALAGVPALVFSSESGLSKLEEAVRVAGGQTPALVVFVALWYLLSLVPAIGFLLAYTTVGTLTIGLSVVVYAWRTAN